jgi:hypothetical protein
VTTIQKLLGHQRLNSTMIYAHVHDRTAAQDEYAAMDRIEQRLIVSSRPEGDPVDLPVTGDEREQLLSLAAQLAEPDLRFETRLDLVQQMCDVLNHRSPPEKKQPTQKENGRRPRAPP